MNLGSTCRSSTPSAWPTAVTSVGSDSYDKGLAESEIGLYKTELIERNKPWKTIEEVELNTLEWIHWFNHRRLHSAVGDVPPVEFEAAYYHQRRPELMGQTRWFTVEADGRVAAMASLLPVRDVGLVDHVVTLPFARRRGYAMAIVRRIEAEARASGIDALVLLTEPEGAARLLYERIGFRSLTTIASTVERRWRASAVSGSASVC